MSTVAEAAQSTQDLEDLELTVLLPCLNEAETLGTCVAKAMRSLEELGVRGEVLVADNGSTDGSIEIAEGLGARVVHVSERGYGSALRGGIAAARGKYVIMADSDDSYDLSKLGPFLQELRQGTQLVMGNRFKGGIEPGAMPPLHKLGNPVLSFVGRLLFRIPVRDFHCGIRGFDRDAVRALELRTPGMEFASELVVRAALEGLTMTEVPTTLSKDGRSHPPHLRTWRDGWRHLRFLLLYSPRWLFLYPGMVLAALGVAGTAVLSVQPASIGRVTFDVQSLLLCAVLVIVGVQLVLAAGAARAFGYATGLLPASKPFVRWSRWVTLERGVVVGLLLLLLGVGGWAIALVRWESVDFGALDARRQLRLVIPSATAIVVGMQVLFGSFLMGLPRFVRPE